MARQKGIIPLEGTIGNITFLKTRDGYLAKEKSSIPASRMYTDPAFARTRENWSEFGNAGQSAKLIRATFNQALRLVKDRRMTGNLVKTLMLVVHSDSVHERGQRRVAAGDLSLCGGRTRYVMKGMILLITNTILSDGWHLYATGNEISSGSMKRWFNKQIIMVPCSAALWMAAGGIGLY